MVLTRKFKYVTPVLHSPIAVPEQAVLIKYRIFLLRPELQSQDPSQHIQECYQSARANPPAEIKSHLWVG